jgi:hypothetical protein
LKMPEFMLSVHPRILERECGKRWAAERSRRNISRGLTRVYADKKSNGLDWFDAFQIRVYPRASAAKYKAGDNRLRNE